MAEQAPLSSHEYQLPPDIAAMIAAGNEARARGVDPEVIIEEHDDDKSYADRSYTPSRAEVVNAATDPSSQAMQDAMQKAKEMGERAAAQQPLLPNARSRAQVDADFYNAHWREQARKNGQGE